MQPRPRPMPGEPPSKCSRWDLVWHLPPLPDGRYPRESAVFRGTKREAEIEWARRESEIKRAGVERLRPDTMLFGDYVEQWMGQMRPHLRPKTVESYEMTLRCHVLPSLGQTPLSKLNRSLLTAWLHRLSGKIGSHGKVLSPRTVSYCRAIVRGCLQEAVRDGLLATNPVELVRAPIQKPMLVPSYSLEDVRKLDPLTNQYRYGPLVATLWRTGLRVGEALALRWSDIDFGRGAISVTKQLIEVQGQKLETRPKSDRGIREVPLAGEAVTVLRNLQASQNTERELRGGLKWNPDAYVFCTERGTRAMHRNTIRAWHLIREHAGLKPAGIHALRHTFASLSLLAGMDLSTLSTILGHENPAFTARIYAHVLTATKVRAISRLDELLASQASDN